MNAFELQAAVRSGDRVFGTCIVSTSPKWPAMIASTGLDFVFLDTEHIPIDRDRLSWMCAAYGASNLAPIVRVPAPDPYLACMALDGGAAGVVFPYVENIEQVLALRGAVKLRPLKGRRLEAILAGRETIEPELAEYVAGWADGKMMIVNIESAPALDALDDILEVPDIDALLIGPHDLSLNLGVPEQYAHPKFKQAVSTIIRKARSKNIGVGLHYSFGIEPEIEWAKEGANFIIHSSDFFLTRDALAADLKRFKTELGEKTKQPTPKRPHDDAI